MSNINHINSGIANDLAYETIIETAKSLCPDLPLELITNLYLIQRKHMFTSDRSIPLIEMQKYIEKYVADQN